MGVLIKSGFLFFLQLWLNIDTSPTALTSIITIFSYWSCSYDYAVNFQELWQVFLYLSKKVCNFFCTLHSNLRNSSNLQGKTYILWYKSHNICWQNRGLNKVDFFDGNLHNKKMVVTRKSRLLTILQLTKSGFTVFIF